MASKSNEILKGTYWLTRICYLRAISFIYCVAFLVAYYQNKQLIGDNGLTPAKLYLERVNNSLKTVGLASKLSSVPTLFWFAASWDKINPWLDNISSIGFTIAGLVFISGTANVIVLLTLWALYFSIVTIGQTWYSFGWESQLLETGLLGLWGVPLFSLSYMPKKFHSPWLMTYGLKWLIIRIMLGAGLIKIRGDQCWLDLTCMNYHYETQPVPNPLSSYLHHLPVWWHMTETFGNHVVELIIPFLGFLNRPCQMICGIIQILFQIILIISGNLSFLNWLTIVPSIAFFDDKFFSFFFTKKSRQEIVRLQAEKKSHPQKFIQGKGKQIMDYCVAGYLLYLSLPVVVNLMSSHQMMNTSFDPFRILNTYGAFGSVTKTRNEVIFQGTYSASLNSPDVKWLEYEFKCKPGNVSTTPCIITPYHYRLDWLMWFAAFQRYEHNPWLVHLAGKFLVNDKDATTLIKYNPFHDKDPPRYVRAVLYEYHYANKGSTNWYKRRRKHEYLPPVDIASLKSIFNKFGWKTFEAQ